MSRESVRLIHECRRQAAYLWGQKHFVTPALVDWIHGDGLQVIYFTPLNTRPNYYVVRVDSRIDLNNQSAKEVCFAEQVLDDLYGHIKDEFLRVDEEWTSDKNGRTYIRRNPFPALNDDSGCEWGNLGFLRHPDTRTERQIRQAIARKKARQ